MWPGVGVQEYSRVGTPGVEGLDLTVQTELAFGEWETSPVFSTKDFVARIWRRDSGSDCKEEGPGNRSRGVF